MFIEIGFKEVLVLKYLFPIRYVFKEHVEIVKIYMVNFNVKILNSPKKRGFQNLKLKTFK